MRLVVFGCSHTHGQGISQTDTFYKTKNGDVTEFNEKSWAVQLSKMLNVELINSARPGSGNNEIVKKILSYVPQKNDIVAVQWTYFGRYTIFRELAHLDILPTYQSKKDHRDYKSMEMFYKLFDDYNLATINTMSVDHGYRILNSLNIPFVSKFVSYEYLDADNVNESNIRRACYYSRLGINLDNQFLIDCQKPDFHTISQQVSKDIQYGADGKHYSDAVHLKIAEAYYNEITSKV